ncbi:hypothetical protein [Rubellimicrobium roseum]|uniref:Uncharacterized protein n=1 Tax=Rubellimicrobium roseum TaxID=687525 RepID=A0A5C4NGY9_9RHOB|nr:hypothetical protein [Rubellimicrobium roseum]TNC73873.1 hypothetical protein FHG71_05235 [Rubellimicrobium roseum]
MARPRRPLFLRPASYRQRRLRDAARLLPVLGIALFLVPLLWTPSDESGGVSNSGALLFVFGVWTGLIVAAHVLSRILRLDAGEDRDEPP